MGRSANQLFWGLVGLTTALRRQTSNRMGHGSALMDETLITPNGIRLNCSLTHP
jgi:hypothetical protein